jgi:probable HAF family extracellular repeat protein
MRLSLFAALALVGLIAILPALNGRAAPMFVPLGGLSGRGYCGASALSADGSVVVGGCDGGSQAPEAFRWTQNGGMVGLGALQNGTSSTSTGVSADGSVIVGNAVIQGIKGVPFRWTQATGMVQFSPDNGIVSARGISSDGSLIFGTWSNGSNGFRGYTWTQQAGVQFNDLFAGFPAAMSGDGSVLVGGNERCVILSASCDPLTGDPNLSTKISALAASADASVVVGFLSPYMGDPSGGAFRWTQASGPVSLDDHPPVTFQFAQAMGVSADGSVIVGMRDYGVGIWPDGSSREPFIWTESGGMQSLRDVLLSEGVDLTGWILEQADAVSADGRVVIGHGTNPNGELEAWVAFVPEPSTALLAFTGLAVLGQRRRSHS